MWQGSQWEGKGGRPASKVDLMELFSIPSLENVSETLLGLAGFRLTYIWFICLNVIMYSYLTPFGQYSLNCLRTNTFPMSLWVIVKKVSKSSATPARGCSGYPIALFCNFLCSWLSMLVVTSVTASREKPQMFSTGLQIGEAFLTFFNKECAT